MGRMLTDLMEVGQIWQAVYEGDHPYAFYLTHRMDTRPAESYWAINLEVGRRVVLYDVRNYPASWERIA